MKTYKCKSCNFTIEGNGPSVMRAHTRDAHGGGVRKAAADGERPRGRGR